MPPPAKSKTSPISRPSSRPDGRGVLVVGASGSGKTCWTAQQVAAERRLLVWDCMGEWARKYHCRRVASLRELGELIRAEMEGRAGGGRVAVQVLITRENFDCFARLAWVWLRVAPGCLVVEELADVTSPGKAPAAWGEIVRKGRHERANVYALTQRPAESDKTILSNCAAIHGGMMNYPDDRAYLARCLDVPLDQVTNLKPLDWIHRDFRTRKLTTGAVSV